MPLTFRLRSTGPALAASLLIATALTGCMGGSSGGGLAPGLTQAINTPGAQMDRGAALSIVNQYRATRGVAALSADAALDQQAQALASQYASSGNPPALPAGTSAMRLSAGYENFAETFSGWRNSPADADVLASAAARRAGLAVVYNPNSAYGTHWVMVLAQ